MGRSFSRLNACIPPIVFTRWVNVSSSTSTWQAPQSPGTAVPGLSARTSSGACHSMAHQKVAAVEQGPHEVLCRLGAALGVRLDEVGAEFQLGLVGVAGQGP